MFRYSFICQFVQWLKWKRNKMKLVGTQNPSSKRIWPTDTLNPNKSSIATTSVLRGPMWRLGKSVLCGNTSLTVAKCRFCTPLYKSHRNTGEKGLNFFNKSTDCILAPFLKFHKRKLSNPNRRVLQQRNSAANLLILSIYSSRASTFSRRPINTNWTSIFVDKVFKFICVKIFATLNTINSHTHELAISRFSVE